MMFRQENFNSTFTRHCRVVTLDSQISIRVKTYSLLWLHEFANVNKRLVRKYFEKDIKLLQSAYCNFSKLMPTKDLLEIRQAI